MGSREDDAYWDDKVYDSSDGYCETCNDYHDWEDDEDDE